MRFYWPKKSKLNLFEEAFSKGQISVELPTNHEAELFRYSLYSFRRRTKNIDKEKFQNLQIFVENNKLTIYKPNEVEIKKLEKEPGPELETI